MIILLFYTTLQNDFIELEKLDYDVIDSAKVRLLNRSLPQELRWVNVFQYNNDWSKCCSYVKNIIPEIIFSNLKGWNLPGNNTCKVVFNLENNISKKKNIKKSKRNFNRKRRNSRSNYCGIRGYYAKECWNKKEDINKTKKKYIYKEFYIKTDNNTKHSIIK